MKSTRKNMREKEEKINFYEDIAMRLKTIKYSRHKGYIEYDIDVLLQLYEKVLIR